MFDPPVASKAHDTGAGPGRLGAPSSLTIPSFSGEPSMSGADFFQKRLLL